MKIVVIGGTGLIGSKTVAILRQRGHEVVAASPRCGINSITGEGLKEASGIPYAVVRATGFLEFLGGIADSCADATVVRLSPGLFQPIAADDVAAIVAEVAVAAPRNGEIEIAGPERALFSFVCNIGVSPNERGRAQSATQPSRCSKAGCDATYFSLPVEETFFRSRHSVGWSRKATTRRRGSS
jgi:hypothetical protein